MSSDAGPDHDKAPDGSATAHADPVAAAAGGDRPPTPEPALSPADDDLVSRLEIVESQPLADRAAAYEAIHEDLARRLEQNPLTPDR